MKCKRGDTLRTVLAVNRFVDQIVRDRDYPCANRYNSVRTAADILEENIPGPRGWQLRTMYILNRELAHREDAVSLIPLVQEQFGQEVASVFSEGIDKWNGHSRTFLPTSSVNFKVIHLAEILNGRYLWGNPDFVLNPCLRGVCPVLEGKIDQWVAEHR